VDDMDRTQRLVDRALQCVDRARRVINHPEEAIDLAGDLRAFAGEFVRWGLEKVPIARDFLPPEPLPADDPPAWESEAAAAPPYPVETYPEAPDAAPPAAADDDEAEATPRSGDGTVGKDQLYKVLRVLYDETLGEGRFLSAREIADAAKKAGLAILPGNVRKILRTRAARHVDTRLRETDTGKVTEFKLAAKGRSFFQKTYPTQ